MDRIIEGMLEKYWLESHKVRYDDYDGIKTLAYNAISAQKVLASKEKSLIMPSGLKRRGLKG